jgi:hypothetical protein
MRSTMLGNSQRAELEAGVDFLGHALARERMKAHARRLSAFILGMPIPLVPGKGEAPESVKFGQDRRAQPAGLEIRQ